MGKKSKYDPSLLGKKVSFKRKFVRTSVFPWTKIWTTTECEESWGIITGVRFLQDIKFEGKEDDVSWRAIRFTPCYLVTVGLHKNPVKVSIQDAVFI